MKRLQLYHFGLFQAGEEVIFCCIWATSSRSNLNGGYFEIIHLSTDIKLMRNRHGGRLKGLDGPVVIEELRGVIKGKAGKAAALPKFSDLLTLFLPTVVT